MEDTDWRPSPCPVCGEMREAARTPVCRNLACDAYIGYAGKEVIMKFQKQYLWVKDDRAPLIVSNLTALYKDRDFNPDIDKIYELGPEVKLELTVKTTPVKPVTRNSSGGYITTFENR